MRNKIIASIISCFVLCCVVGGGIWAAVNSVATVQLSVPAVTKQCFYGELSISVEGNKVESGEDEFEPFVQKINYNEKSAAVTFNPLNEVDIDLDEYGGPKPIVVTFTLDVKGYIGETNESGIDIYIVDEITGEGAESFSVTSEGLNTLEIESREAFEDNGETASISIKYTIIQTAVFETIEDEFFVPADLQINLTFYVST